MPRTRGGYWRFPNCATTWRSACNATFSRSSPEWKRMAQSGGNRCDEIAAFAGGTNGKFEFKTALDRNLNKKYVRVMNTHRHSRCCPSCGHHFIPWNTWQISQWSCLKCPSCGARLNRRRDAQFFLMLFVGIILVVSPVLLMLIGFPIAGVIPLIVIAAFLVWLVDVLTVRLVVAGRWRGFRGYEA